jgi:hypothetical protein
LPDFGSRDCREKGRGFAGEARAGSIVTGYKRTGSPRRASRGDEYRSRGEGWLSKADAKRDSIQESIKRIGEWIGEDERRRDDIRAKQR